MIRAAIRDYEALVGSTSSSGAYGIFGRLFCYGTIWYGIVNGGPDLEQFATGICELPSISRISGPYSGWT